MCSCTSDSFVDEYIPKMVKLDNVKVYIPKYYKDKPAAITLTFDDGSRGQYTYAAPQLESRNLPATFFVNGTFIQPITCPEDDHLDSLCLKDLVERGFEVSNHTWSHVNLTTISIDSAKTELMLNDEAIERWTGVRPTTMSFPNNARTPQVIDMAMVGRVGVRFFEEGFGQSFRHSSFGDMRRWADDIISNRNWGVAMFHAIDRGYDHWEDPSQLWKFFDYLAAQRDNVWIANFHDAMSYIKERDNAEIKLFKDESGNIYVNLSMPLDAQLYTHPITLVVAHNGANQLVDMKPNTTVVVYRAN